ncbi:MAG: HU family DNA-binding protein [Nitrosomonadales bacterium]|nr:HU family DNA-binding protein [Nitrosomonadales bacterium]
MTRSELIRRLATRHPQLAAEDIKSIVAYVLDKIGMALAEGERVEIRGFGSFNRRLRSARKWHNPVTDMTYMVPAKLVPHFKPGKRLRDGIENNNGDVEPRIGKKLRILD